MKFLPSKDKSLPLIEPKLGELTSGRVFEVLNNIRAEDVWLANFASLNTREAYKRAVASFVATVGN